MDPSTNAYKAVLTGLPYTDSDTEIGVDHVTGLPDPATEGAFNLVLWNRAHGSPGDAKNNDEFEIIRVTAITGTTLTVERGQEGTTAITLGASASWTVVNAVTVSMLEKISEDAQNTIKTFQFDPYLAYLHDAAVNGLEVNNADATRKILRSE